MNQDQIISLIRSVLKVGGGALVSRGLVQDSQWQEIVGILAAIIGLLWAQFSHRTTDAKAIGDAIVSGDHKDLTINQAAQVTAVAPAIVAAVPTAKPAEPIPTP